MTIILKEDAIISHRLTMDELWIKLGQKIVVTCTQTMEVYGTEVMSKQVTKEVRKNIAAAWNALVSAADPIKFCEDFVAGSIGIDDLPLSPEPPA